MSDILDSPYGRHLPIFPCLDYAPITEDRVESTVERLVNRADRAFMADGSTVTQAQYDAWQRALSRWADEQYGKV